MGCAHNMWGILKLSDDKDITTVDTSSLVIC